MIEGGGDGIRWHHRRRRTQWADLRVISSQGRSEDRGHRAQRCDGRRLPTSEFVAPGFKHNSHSSYHFIGEGPVLSDLELHKYGLAYIYPEVQHAQVFRDGKALTIHRSVENTAKSIARFSQNDAKRYKELCQRFVTEMGPVMTEFMYSVPLPPAELGKRLSGPQWDDLLSYMPLTLHQAVERNFESEYVRMFFNCILHAIAIENVPGVGAFFPRLLSRLTKLGLPVGGAGSVALALERLLEDNGATLIRNAHVSAITSDSKGVTGVRLQNGDTYSARFVASAIDAPQTIRSPASRTSRRTWSRASRDSNGARTAS